MVRQPVLRSMRKPRRVGYGMRSTKGTGPIRHVDANQYGDAASDSVQIGT